jgi:endonuclease/exonuclease/phosphatase family metal-dependent hydrolase
MYRVTKADAQPYSVNFALLMDQIHRIATYNIRYANNKDTGNLWVDRRAVVTNLIRFHAFDILGTQEGLKSQLDDITHALPYFSRFGVARDDGQESGEHAAIFYRSAMYKLVDGGTFWLSEKSDQPGFGWDARHNRICTWINLKIEQSGKQIFVFNAHFDHYGQVAREESSKLVLQRIRKIAGQQPTILMGDFNADHSNECYRLLEESSLLRDVYHLADHPYVNNPSFNSWGNASPENRLIDHIFVTDHFKAVRHGVLTDTYFGKCPSDHFPVMADLTIL